MHRAATVLGLTAALLAPGSVWAQESDTSTVGMSPSPQPSAVTATPVPSPPTCTSPYGSPTARLVYDVSDTDVVAGERVTVSVSVTGAMKASVWMQGYEWISPTERGPLPLTRTSTSAQHADWYSGDVPEGETRTHTWSLSPEGNTRVLSRHTTTYGNCGPQGYHPEYNVGIINVAPRLTIDAVRNGVRDYSFSGEASRPDQLLSLYRVTSTGAHVLTSQTRATEEGTWTIHRKFLGSGRFGFVLRTGRDMMNAPGASRVRDTVIH